MIKDESAIDLFQRLNRRKENRYESIINRLNRYHQILFPRGFQNQFIELLDKNRIATKRFLHGFIEDYIEYRKYRNDLLLLPFKTDKILSDSPQANKDSVESEIPTFQLKFHYDRSIAFIYIDTESKEDPFDSELIEWYDCETSSELVGTLLRLEHSHFLINSDQQYVLIIDSSTQVPINDYYRTTTLTHVMPIEENKLLTVQWHRILCHLVMKYRLSCILVEHLDVETATFDTLIGKRDEKFARRNSKNKEVHIPYSEYAFGRLMTSEHYELNGLEYRQIRQNEMISFQYEINQSSVALNLSSDDQQMRENNENNC